MNKKILFVDDEMSALDRYRRSLENEFDISTAMSAEDGLAMLRTKGPFAVVASDMCMSGIDGSQFLKHVRELSPNTIRLMITGYADFENTVKAVNEGAVFRFLTKPCEKVVLQETIRVALAQYRERREERIRIELPVRICRNHPTPMFQLAYTLDISNSGARLAGLRESPSIGEVIEVECGKRKASFRVRWVGTKGSDTEGQAGVERLPSAESIWSLELSQSRDTDTLIRARAVQRGLLPQKKPRLGSLDYAGHCIQARTVGGDYYDFLDLGPGKVGFVLADVAGKGIAAALLMANLQGIIHSGCDSGLDDLPHFLTSVNRHFYEHTSSDRYATFFFGSYCDSTRTLQYVNCGHNPPLVLRAGGSVERLAANATVLGLFQNWECSVAETRLGTGDVLSIFSDGITETTGPDGKEFGEGGLLETLRTNRNLDAEFILQNAELAADQFRSGELEDDLTLVIARGR